MTPEEKANELIEFFKPIVYPYMGSSMLTNDYDDNVILRNAKICAEKCCDEILGFNHDTFLLNIQAINYWQKVKQIINGK